MYKREDVKAVGLRALLLGSKSTNRAKASRYA